MRQVRAVCTDVWMANGAVFARAVMVREADNGEVNIHRFIVVIDRSGLRSRLNIRTDSKGR